MGIRARMKIAILPIFAKIANFGDFCQIGKFCRFSANFAEKVDDQRPNFSKISKNFPDHLSTFSAKIANFAILPKFRKISKFPNFRKFSEISENFEKFQNLWCSKGLLKKCFGGPKHFFNSPLLHQNQIFKMTIFEKIFKKI